MTEVTGLHFQKVGQRRAPKAASPLRASAPLADHLNHKKNSPQKRVLAPGGCF